MKNTQIQSQHYKGIQKRFLRRKKDEGKSASFISSVTTLSKEFLIYLEAHHVSRLEDVKQKHIDNYFQYLSKRKNKRKAGGLSNSYLMKHREAVLRLLEYVKDVEIGQSGYYIPVIEKERIPKDILTEDEVITLFSSQSNDMNGIRNKAILSVLYGCGLRKKELYNLNIEDIDMFKEVIRVQKSKNAHQRDVPLSPTVKRHLEAYLFSVRQMLLPEHKEEPALLLNNRGGRMSMPGIAQKLTAIKAKTTITKPVSAHRLRHAIATHLLGVFSLEEIAQFLGHKNVDSSQIYVHIKHTKYPKAI